METNAPDVLPGPRAFIRRDAGIDRAKIYHLGVPTGPGADFTISSVVDYSITTDFEWSAAVDGAARYTVFSGAANIVNIGGVDNLVMIRNASIVNKVGWTMFWFEPGTYELPRTATITGGGTAGASYVVTSASDGNITTPAPLSSLSVNAATPITFTVTTGGVYYLVINQASSAGNAGHELRLASLGQPVKIA